jgi:hypothetical protein
MERISWAFPITRCVNVDLLLPHWIDQKVFLQDVKVCYTSFLFHVPNDHIVVLFWIRACRPRWDLVGEFRDLDDFQRE